MPRFGAAASAHLMKVLGGLVVLLLLAACETRVESNPARTATEQMLISTAADRATAQFDLPLVPGTAIFLDDSRFEGVDAKYAIATLREKLLEKQLRLVDDKNKADVVIEARAGALSTDRTKVLLGLPELQIPVPFASEPVTIPQLALFGIEDQKGVAKFSLAAYEPKQGRFVAAQGPAYGFAHHTKRTLLIFLSWDDTDYIPDNAECPRPNIACSKEPPQ